MTNAAEASTSESPVSGVRGVARLPYQSMFGNALVALSTTNSPLIFAEEENGPNVAAVAFQVVPTPPAVVAGVNQVVASTDPAVARASPHLRH